MKFLFFVFCVLFGVLIYCSFKYRNPYKLIYILGKKGSFKSTFMVSLMLSHLKTHWTVYTNMDDVLIPGVRVMDVKSLMDCAPPPHSVLFIDEAGLIWDNRKFKSFSDGYTEFFKFQRKYNCKCYINSQALDIDKKIRDLIDSVYLMNGLFNCIGVARRVKRVIGVVDASAQGESRFADNFRFDSIFTWRFIWGPKYFKYFDSYKAPSRDPVPFTEVVGDLRALRSKQPLLQLKAWFKEDSDD